MRPVSWQEVAVEATVQTVVGLPGPLVRVTWYCAPVSWLAGRVQPMVMAPLLPFAVAVGVVGAERLAATACAGLELSVVSQ